MKLVFWSLFIESHGMMPATIPMMMAPQPLTKPAAGVIRHQARDHAVDRADDRRLAIGHLVHQRPDEKGDRRRRVGVEHGRARIVVGEIRIAAVEAVPTQPQDAGADQGDQQAVGRKLLAISPQAWPDHGCGDKAGCAGGEMDDVAAGKVLYAQLREPAAAPQAERPDRIDQGHPHRAEDHPRREVHAAEHRAPENDHRDRSEHELEEDQGSHREGQFRHAGGRCRYHRLARE